MNWRKRPRRTHELQQDRLERAAEDMRQSCDHDCPSCRYFDRVYELTGTEFIKLDSAELKRAHTSACFRGEPSSLSCYEAHERIRLK